MQMFIWMSSTCLLLNEAIIPHLEKELYAFRETHWIIIHQYSY